MEQKVQKVHAHKTQHWLGHFGVNLLRFGNARYRWTSTPTHSLIHTHTGTSMYTHLADFTIKVVVPWKCDCTSTCAYTPTKTNINRSQSHHVIGISYQKEQARLCMYAHTCLFSPLHIFIHIWAQSWVYGMQACTLHWPTLYRCFARYICCYAWSSTASSSRDMS